MKRLRFWSAVLLMVVLATGVCPSEECSSGWTHTIYCEDLYSETSGGRCPVFVPLGCTCEAYCR